MSVEPDPPQKKDALYTFLFSNIYFYYILQNIYDKLKFLKLLISK